MKPHLRFNKNQIRHFANRYEYKISDTALTELIPIITGRGHLIKKELEIIAYWKAPRSSRYASKNNEEYVADITRFAFSCKSERARVESLRLLDGVSWPTATVILHFFHVDPYPILDFRALWSLSLEVPAQYNFDFWWPYAEFCRELSQKAGVDMRTLDKALWQYSKENQ